MIIPDINLLIYAYDSSSPFHASAVDWWQSCLGGTEPIGLHVRAWLGQPPVQLIVPGHDHLHQTLELLETLGTAGNLVSDAQMAALALDHGAVLHTADTDFVRFPGLRWFNPITGTGTTNRRRTRSA